MIALNLNGGPRCERHRVDVEPGSACPKCIAESQVRPESDDKILADYNRDLLRSRLSEFERKP